jgi:pyruvate ferredoxin oxidoreductase alpha subunit
MRHAPAVISEVGKLYGELSGRAYDLIEEYRMDGAELVAVALGSTCGTAKAVVDELRSQGLPVGLLKIRSFRPFPEAEIGAALSSAKAVAVLDRSISFGAPGGPVHKEIKASLYGSGAGAGLVNYIYGLGGRDISTEQIAQVFEDLKAVATAGTPPDNVRFVGLRS